MIFIRVKKFDDKSVWNISVFFFIVIEQCFFKINL